MDKMFKINIVLKIVSLLYNNCFKETANKVSSSLSLCSDVAAAHMLTLSKQLNKLKRTGGDRATFEVRAKMVELSVRTTTNAREQKWKRQRARTIIELRF